VVPDDREEIATALRRLADADIRFVFTTGGTGMPVVEPTLRHAAATLERG
jgi:molybdopterin biosynthesis enzyme MoaB